MLVCPILLCGALALAQDEDMPRADRPASATTGSGSSATPSSAAAPRAGARASAGVIEAQPSIVWLENQHGELQPVVNFPLEEFEQLRELKNGLGGGAQRPAFGLQMAAEGQVDDRHAALNVEFTVRTNESGWIRVPLRLSEALLIEPETYDGPGEQFLTFDDQEEEGYVSWIRGEPGQEHRLQMRVLVPLATVGGETRLRLSVPRLPTSQLKLTVPGARAVGQVPMGTLLEQEAVRDEATQFTIVGLDSDFEFAWREDSAKIVEVPIVLEATGSLIARIDGRSVSTEATLRVKSHAGEFDRFRIRLPQGAELVTRQQPGYTLHEAPREMGLPPEEARRVIEVRLEQKTTSAVVQLVTEQPHNRPMADEFVDLAGFEVLGAVPQSGHLAVAVVGDWQVVWGDRRNVRQVADLPGALRVEGLVSGFEYLAQPCSLLAKVIPRTSRVGVEPQYIYYVDPDQVRLEARLNYTVHGAKVFALDIDIPGDGWHVDEIGPANVVDLFGVVFEQVSPLSIPLLQPVTGEVEIVLRAHRRLTDADEALSLSLPRPRVNSVGPATVVIVPADNVQLTPRIEENVGLSRQQVPPQMELPPRQQEPLFYRGEVARATFVAGIEVHPRKVTADVTSRVEIDEQGGHVEQLFALRIDHEPLSQLLVEVPQSIAGSDSLEFVLDGQALTWARAANEHESSRPDTERVVVLLPAERIGTCEVTVRYPLRETRLVPHTSIVYSVPLAMPADCELRSNDVHVTTKPGIEVQPRDEGWTIATNGRGPLDRDSGLRLSASQPMSQVSLALNLEDSQTLGATWIERAWIQSWLGETTRRDRAVYRLVTNRRQLNMRLPDGVVLPSIEVWLDGKRVAKPLAADDVLTIDMPSGEQQEHVLELLYQLDQRAPRGGYLSLAAPRFDDNTFAQWTYWQVVLPREVHLISSPSTFTRAFQWAWEGMHWGRRPLWEQFDLENWVGAPHQTEVPSDTNRYLLSTLGVPTQLELRTANRALLVLVASGAALVAGLLLIYVPAVRHPGALFVATVALLAFALFSPELALLAAQAASLGVVLTLVAALLERLFSGRRMVEVPSSSTSARLERGSTHSRPIPSSAPAVAGSQDSTDTSPMPVPASAPDSSQ